MKTTKPRTSKHGKASIHFIKPVPLHGGAEMSEYYETKARNIIELFISAANGHVELPDLIDMDEEDTKNVLISKHNIAYVEFTFGTKREVWMRRD